MGYFCQELYRGNVMEQARAEYTLICRETIIIGISQMANTWEEFIK
jgi:hypothetical protein